MDPAGTRRVERICEEAMALLGTAQQVEPFSRRYPGFDLAEAYGVAAQVRDLRCARGERPIGRKIGFTNRAVWGAYGISAPIWNYVFDRTVKEGAKQPLFELAGMPEPRIEPEIVLHIARAPAVGMNTMDLIECVDWVAPGFEVVYSIFPNWEFSAADAAAAYGVHGALILGEMLNLDGMLSERAAGISKFDVEMVNNRGVSRTGNARNVLGGPLEALKFLVEEIARYPVCEPLHANELVTTGTLTEAMAAMPGEVWNARFHGIDLKPLHLCFG